MEYLYLLILTLVLSGFFSGIELAFVSSNKLRIELDRKKGLLSGKILSRFLNNQSHFLGTTLIGNNIALILFSILMSLLLENQIRGFLPDYAGEEVLVLIILTMITTLLVLVFGEFFPKILFRINPNFILSLFAVPLWIFYYLLYPLVMITVVLSKFILNKILRVEFEDTGPVFNKYDLEHIVRQPSSGGRSQKDEEIKTDLFEKALYLIDVKIRECMIPRTEIVAIEHTATMDELKNAFIENSVSKILIYKENIDNILGYVHHFELLKKPDSISEIIFPIPVVPETMPARDLLAQFIKDQKSIAWVIDEYGGTAGIVTIEDVLEEIFGEIRDEYDSDEYIEKQIAEDEYIFSGRMEIDYLNEKYNLNFPEGEYETLSGMVISAHESIPAMGEKIRIDDFLFTILNMTETKIETLKVKINYREDEEVE